MIEIQSNMNNTGSIDRRANITTYGIKEREGFNQSVGDGYVIEDMFKRLGLQINSFNYNTRKGRRNSLEKRPILVKI